MPFLRLPAELRLQIYSFLPASEEEFQAPIQNRSTSRLVSARSKVALPKSSTTYAYLYRSPGRITKHRAIGRTTVDLFHVCHLMRAELVDYFFGDRTFIIEASFYSRGVGGLDVMPPRLPLAVCIKNLLIVTILDTEKGQPKGVCNMLPLQEMINLRTLRILFKAPEAVHPLKVANSPVWAILSCVPQQVQVTFGFESASNGHVKAKLEKEFSRTLDYVLEGNPNGMEAYDRYTATIDQLNEMKGSFSGSRTNHENCRFPTCIEQEIDVPCVNAQTPNALPALGVFERAGEPRRRKYQCGCKIASVMEGSTLVSAPTTRLACASILMRLGVQPRKN